VIIIRQKGFSLIELVMVIAIIGILVAVAVPSYKSSTAKARRSDGQTALMDAMVREERYFTEHNTYTTTLADAKAATASPEGYYTISAAACSSSTIASCVKLTATAGSVQASDGNLTLDSRGQKLPADKW
jgi:type IV pilus assembly protein PilE